MTKWLTKIIKYSLFLIITLLGQQSFAQIDTVICVTDKHFNRYKHPMSFFSPSIYFYDDTFYVFRSTKKLKRISDYNKLTKLDERSVHSIYPEVIQIFHGYTPMKFISPEKKIIAVGTFNPDGAVKNFAKYFHDGQTKKVIGQFSELSPGHKIGTWYFFNKKGELRKTKQYGPE